MKARLLVFPIKGRRNWCFSQSAVQSSGTNESNIPSTFTDLWNNISSKSSHNSSSSDSNLELIIDFSANKMSRAWSNLEKAPPGSFKSKIHGLGLRLLSRVKPSEIFLKSIPKDVTHVDITYPSSLNGRLVRRRVRHMASRGTVIHKKYFYGSVALLPLTSFFMVLPLPNIPFFWVLFRTYSHWRALKGSEKLLQLVTDCSHQQKSDEESTNKTADIKDDPKKTNNYHSPPWVLLPSDDLQKLIGSGDANDGLSESTISDICQRYRLNTMDVIKYQHSL